MLTEKQHSNRDKGIGGSDAPVVCGLSQWKQPLQLYYEKRGEMTFPDPTGEHIHFGNVLEDAILLEAARRLDVKVGKEPNTLYHEKYKWMLGNIDAWIVNKPWIIEAKNVGFKSAEWGPDGSDQVPDAYLIQCMHYLAVTGAELCKLAALFSGNHMRIYHIERDESLIEQLIETENNFWTAVEAGVPPRIDYEHKTTGDLIRQMYPGTTGEIIDLPADIVHWHKVREDAAKKEALYRSSKQVAEYHIMSTMGEAAVAKLPDGTAYTRKEIKRKGYTVEPSSYIDFRHTKKPKGVEK